MNVDAFEYPPEQQADYDRACRLEWVTIAYLLSAVLLLYLVLGGSQAMKTVLWENALSLIPPTLILIVSRITFRAPDQKFPYGYHRVVSIAFLCAALALVAMGGWLLIHAIMILIRQERPTIGGITLLGHTIWLGWLMLPALVWSAVPPFFLGHAKLRLARRIHDKALHTDAEMNKADWTSSTAAMLGILGIGIGWWWADAVAAAAISCSILWDGFSSLKEVVLNLMDETPKTVDRHELDPLPQQIEDYLEQLDWVREANVRMRENGHIFFGEALVVVRQEDGLVKKLDGATRHCLSLDWRLYDFHIVPVESLPGDRGDIMNPQIRR